MQSYSGGFNPHTGDQVWDQNLSTLGSALFPDQAKIGQAYHYGSAARQAQLESNLLIDKMNRRPYYDMMTNGGPQPALPVYQPMTNVPGAPPVVAPPANLPYAGAPAAAPAAAPLSSMVAAASTMTPGQAAEMVPRVIEPLTTGTPPPGTPPTGTAGAVLPNDPASGQLHFSSVNTTGGGRQQAPPAAQNGSPAPMPPGMTLPGILAMHSAGALAGIDAQTLAGGGQALAYELFNRDMIDEHRLKIMLGTTGQAGPWQQDIQAASAARVANIGASAELAKQGMVTGENRRQFEATTKPTVDPTTGEVTYTPQSQLPGKRFYEPTVAVEKVRQADTPGQYFIPGTGETKTMTAGQAIAAGVPAAATSSDQQLSQVRQRIENEKDPAKRAQMIAQAQALAATPKELDPEKQFAQNKFDYRVTQQIYSQPQKGALQQFGINEPAAFDFATNTEIDKRAFELSQQPGKAYLKTDPSKAREAAIHDLMKNPTAEGMRLPTPAEVAQQRRPTRQRLATLGTYGDPRLDDFTNPNVKGAEPSAHMMIRLVPQDYKPPPNTETTGARAPATGAPAAGATATPPISSVIPGSTAAQSPTQLYGGVVPGATPSPGLGGRILQGAQAIGQAGRAANPAPMSPAQIYGSQPAAPGATAAPAGPASGGAPPGALGPAPDGSVEGQTGVHRATGQLSVNRGGWMYPVR